LHTLQINTTQLFSDKQNARIFKLQQKLKDTRTRKTNTLRKKNAHPTAQTQVNNTNYRIFTAYPEAKDKEDQILTYHASTTQNTSPHSTTTHHRTPAASHSTAATPAFLLPPTTAPATPALPRYHVLTMISQYDIIYTCTFMQLSLR